MTSLTKVVNGKVVTNTNVKPPTGWTVDYSYFGGESEWGEDGEVADLVGRYGISGVVKPLFRTPYNSNEAIFVIEINEQYYIYNIESGWVQRIVSPVDLKEIVEFINEHKYWRLETEDLG
ncbi:hypothetical protein FAUST_11319 [Fusarium austroamericanum]|uniref:Uncharacterized protein n=1 Tax=Fusarium austroamericanum TaxID=282268 RepID=A0AAN6BUF3_FUSAU|nr:hypothetical protein FAUST_11319 [Fusarium austroamericanum]